MISLYNFFIILNVIRPLILQSLVLYYSFQFGDGNVYTFCTLEIKVLERRTFPHARAEACSVGVCICARAG